MGKRSNFERREADFYPTPRAAVVPLIPFLRGIRSVGRIPEHAENQVVHRPVIVRDQPIKCGLRAGLQLTYKLSFISAPREGAGPIGHGLPFFAKAPTAGSGEPAWLGWTLPGIGEAQPLSALSIRHRRERKCFPALGP